MKNKSILILAVIATAAALSGCTSTGLVKKLAEFEQLGVAEVEIHGKFTATTYKVEIKDGERTATLDHTNAWLPKVRVVRRTPAEASK